MSTNSILENEDTKHSRKSLGMKAAVAGVQFANILGSASSAFDACPDFSKLNSGRHQGTRANTFNTPPSLVKPFTPAAAARQPSRGGPTKELLEVFEMGVARSMANLRNEIREEFSHGLDTLRQDVLSVISDVRGLNLLTAIDKKVNFIKDGPVNVDFQQILDEIRLTHTSIRDALQNSTAAIVRQVGQQTGKLGDDLRTITSEQADLAKELHAQSMAALNGRCGQLDGKLETSIGLQRSFDRASEAGRQEVREMQHKNEKYQERAAVADGDALERDTVLAAAVEQLGPKLQNLQGMQQSLFDSQRKMHVVSVNIEQEALNYRTKLVPTLQNELQKNFEKHNVGLDLSPIVRQVEQFQHVMNFQFPKMMGEIGKIQEAMNVDFCRAEDFVMEFGVDALVVSELNMHRGFSKGSMTNVDSRKSSKVHPFVDESRPSSPGILMTLMQSERRSQKSVTSAGLVNYSIENLGLVRKGGGAKRVRHYWCQTEQDTCDSAAQTDREDPSSRIVPDKITKTKSDRRAAAPKLALLRRRSQQTLKPVFTNSESMKQKARKALLVPQFRVTDLYHTTGIAQKIASSIWFEYLTFLMIFLNAIWIAIDVDLNTSPILFEAHPVFQVGENVFCIYFCWELLTRFGAFKIKRTCLKDRWFIFDFVLVFLMVLETWVITLVFLAAGMRGSSSLSNLSLLRLFRLVKILRVTRMARLMRGLPELFILLKGLRAASRSVALFWVLWWILIYVYALIFRLVSDGPTVYFNSMPQAMNSLLLDAILPNHAHYVRAVTEENIVFWILILSFIAVAYVLLMNMLVGVLVEVVQAIAVTEKDGIAVVSLATDLRSIMYVNSINIETGLNKECIEHLVGLAEFATVVEEAGADVHTVADMLHSMFEDQSDEDGKISFEDFVEAILSLRGANPVKVKDVKSQLRAIKVAVKETEVAMRGALFDEMNDIRAALNHHMLQAAGRDDDDNRSVAEGSIAAGSDTDSFQF